MAFKYFGGFGKFPSLLLEMYNDNDARSALMFFFLLGIQKVLTKFHIKIDCVNGVSEIN